MLTPLPTKATSWDWPYAATALTMRTTALQQNALAGRLAAIDIPPQNFNYNPNRRRISSGTLATPISEPSSRRKRYFVFWPGAAASSIFEMPEGLALLRLLEMRLALNVVDTKR